MLRRLKVLTCLLTALMVSSTTTAPNANAIIGGSTASHLRGQVQFWIDGEQMCSGTLIGGNWVLTAKHCITKYGATIHNSSIYAGSRHLGEGHRMTIAGIYKHATQDAALLNLWQNVPNYENVVVGYGLGSPGLTVNVAISGWGVTTLGSEDSALELQIASMRVNRFWYHDPIIGSGNTAISYVYNGSGVTAAGDSGGGVYIAGRIFAVHCTGDGISTGTGVLTHNIAPWIQSTTGISPS